MGTLSQLLQRLQSQGEWRKAIAKTLAGGIGVQLTLIVTGIVLARALGPEDRGYLALITLVWAVASQFGGFGIPFGLSFASARAPGAALRALESVRSQLIIQIPIAVIASAAALWALTAGSPNYVQIGAAFAVVAVAPAILQQCGLNVLQGLREFNAFNLLRLQPNLMFAVIAAILLAIGTNEFLLFAGGWALSRAVWGPFTIRMAARRAEAVADPEIDPISPKQILSFGRRSLFGGSPPLETYRVDQSIVAIFLAPVALGYYVVSLAFVTLPRFIAQAFGMVASPAIASQPSHSDAQRLMWRIWFAAFPFYALPIAILMVFAPTLTELLFGPEFAPSAPITRIMLLATLLFCARRLLSDGARGAGYPGVGSAAEIVAVVAIIPLLAVFVPLWDLKGVAYAMVGASAVGLVALLLGLIKQLRKGVVPVAWVESQRSGPERVPAAPLEA